jgi:conserved oligomeric Golgi complex subunit 3
LEELSLVLYDQLRPLIIHVSHIETLAELCSILKAEILMDNINSSNSSQLTAFENVCTQLLEDIQERLVYRTHIYIHDEILGYKPSPGDLAYPEKLEIMQQISEKIKAESNNDNSNKVENQSFASPADIHGMWYPTLKRTLICLSKLYRCLDKKIFEGLAQETLGMCIQSLTRASEQIIANKSSRKDGELFLIKHLLILREQILPFNNEFSVVEMELDFSKIKDAAYGLMFNKKAKLFRLDRDNALFDFLQNVI